MVAQLGERGVAIERLDDHEFASAAETDSPQGILAIAEVPDRSLAALSERATLRVLVLDAVQDPGNVGTIVRTAAALGADATVALPGTVDLWNAKVVRSGMGAHFHHLCFPVTWDDLDAFRRAAADGRLGCRRDWRIPADPERRPAAANGAPGGKRGRRPVARGA